MNLNPKVGAAGGTGAATLVVVWVASLFGIEMPDAVAGAIVLLASLAAAYLKPQGDWQPK